MTSKVQGNKRNRQGNREAPEKKFRSYSCIGSEGENGGKFRTFYKKEIAELLPKKHSKNSQQRQLFRFLILLIPYSLTKGLKTAPFGAAH